MSEQIANRCPSCGAKSLFIGEGGWITCSVIGCKKPALEESVEDLREQVRERDAQLAEFAVICTRVKEKCAQYWNEHNFSDAEVHAILRWIAKQHELELPAAARSLAEDAERWRELKQRMLTGKLGICDLAFIEKLACRDNDGNLLTVEFREPDDLGLYSPVVTRHRDNNLVALKRAENAVLSTRIERLREALEKIARREVHRAAMGTTIDEARGASAQFFAREALAADEREEG